MNADDIKKLPTPETDAFVSRFTMSRYARAIDLYEEMASDVTDRARSLEQQRDALMMALDWVRSTYDNPSTRHIAQHAANETLAAIRSMK